MLSWWVSLKSLIRVPHEASNRLFLCGQVSWFYGSYNCSHILHKTICPIITMWIPKELPMIIALKSTSSLPPPRPPFLLYFLIDAILVLNFSATSFSNRNLLVGFVIREDWLEIIFVNLLNVFLSVVVAVAKFTRVVVVSRAISINANVYAIIAL